MMNFNIIEGEPSFWDSKPEFIRLYNDGLRKKDIQAKLKLTNYAWLKLVKECANEGKILKRKENSIRCYKDNKEPVNCYYDKNTGHWNVIYRHIFYAHFDNKEQGQAFVKIMKEQYNWDYSKRKSVKEYILKKGVN